MSNSKIIHWKVEDCNLFRFDISSDASVSLSNIFHDEIAIIGFRDCIWKSCQNGREYIETPDCLVIRNAGQVFSLESASIGTRGGLCRELRISPNHLIELCNKYEIRYRALDFSNPIIRDLDLRQQFFRTHAVLESSHSPLEKELYLAGFIKSLVERGNTAVLSKRYPDNKKYLNTVIEYLRENYNSRITLTELSEIAHTNPFVLLRQFRRHIGVTPHEYLNNLKVIQARQHISKGMTLTEVAHICGFADQSHLTRNFRKRVGVTPGQFLDK